MIVRYEVFDEDYVPEEILFRDTQIRRIAVNLKPAEHGSRPVNMLCLGPPATGKTTVIKHVMRMAEHAVTGVYVNCQVHQTRQQIFLRIFEHLHGYIPPSGISFQKLYSAILRNVVEEGRILLVVLDDVNLLPAKLADEVIFLILKGHEEVDGFKAGLVGISTDMKFLASLDAKTTSVFHPDEVVFPVYDFEEMLEILRKRAVEGVVGGRVSDEALEMIAERAFEYLDLRFGIQALKMAVLNADRKGRDVVGVEDVEEVLEQSRTAFFRKMISALSREEADVLAAIYTSDVRYTGDIYAMFRSRLSYTKFYEILRKLENLRLIDTATKYDRGLKRYVVRRFRADEVLSAIDEFLK
ncbi:MAG: AAA family ATPase [Archaeoglobi archaeon]|nr:AAA family ATPase [Archaeoglobi archaeon]